MQALESAFRKLFQFSNSFLGIGPAIIHSYLKFPNILKGMQRICGAFYFIYRTFVQLVCLAMNNEH